MYTEFKKWSVAKKQVYNGQRYDSKFEAGHAQELDLLLRAKEIKGYDRQVNIDLIVNGYLVCQYRIDFIVYHNDGTTEFQECKGLASEVWKLKWKLFEALYSEKPGVKLTIIYQGKNWRPRLRKVKQL